MILLHKQYCRLSPKGVLETLNFDHPMETPRALLAVNRWNYIAVLQPNHERWTYYLPTADGVDFIRS